jgi:hypothetical protein
MDKSSLECLVYYLKIQFKKNKNRGLNRLFCKFLGFYSNTIFSFTETTIVAEEAIYGTALRFVKPNH